MARIDRSACIGCGLCQGINSEIFEMDDENLAKVIKNDFTEADLEDLDEAIASCPVGAIEKD